MSGNSPRLPACERAREWIHRALDGELTEVSERAELDGHLESCTACREFQSELRWIQEGLRGLPVTPLPDDALEQVWDRTTRRRKIVPFRRRAFDWRLAAAAAVIFMVAFLGIRTWQLPGTTAEPTEAELARAAQEMRLVLSLTSDALRKSGVVAVRDVLAEEVSPALQKMPVRWPAGSVDGQRRSES